MIIVYFMNKYDSIGYRFKLENNNQTKLMTF